MLAEFHYEGSTTTVPSLSHSISTQVSPNEDMSQYLLDMAYPSPDLSLPLGSGLPDSLDVEKWLVCSEHCSELRSIS